MGQTRAGVNDMGGNVWEWASDASGSDRLTMGGSWWYGPAQAQADGAPWKLADFSAVYMEQYVVRRCRDDVLLAHAAASPGA